MGADRGDERGEVLLEEVFGELREWRSSHPKATFAEIEQVVDERLNEARARFVEDLALEGADGGRASCPECGKLLISRGQTERQVTVAGNRRVRLKRTYATCPACSAGLFPPG